MAPKLRIELAHPQDILEIIAIVIPSFVSDPSEVFLGNIDTLEARRQCGQRHLRAWREHEDETGRPCAIKCINNDEATGKETIVAFAEWFIFDKPRLPDHAQRVNYLISASWISSDSDRFDTAKKLLQPVIDLRLKWTTGKGHAILMYMSTNPAWRRKGAATTCVNWGIQQCRELGIMAYLEASKEGALVYERMGFQSVEELHVSVDGVEENAIIMIWWPPGTREEDKKPYTC